MMFIEGFILVVCLCALYVSIMNHIALKIMESKNPVYEEEFKSTVEKIVDKIAQVESSQYSKEADEFMEKLNADMKHDQDVNLDNIF